MKLKDRFKIYLRYQSFNQKAPEILERKIKEISQEVSFFSSIRLPIKKKRLTLLRSPHVNKKSRDQLEIRLYNGLIVLSTHSLSCGFLKALYECYFPEISLKISITSNFQNIKC